MEQGILVVSLKKEFTKMVQQLAEEIGINISVMEYASEKEAIQRLSMENCPYDVLISIGNSTITFRKKFLKTVLAVDSRNVSINPISLDFQEYVKEILLDATCILYYLHGKTPLIDIESGKEGILLIDWQGNIFLYNHLAARLLHLSANCRGKGYADVGSPLLCALCEDETYYLNKFFADTDSKLLVNRTPIMNNGEVHGVLLNIQSERNAQRTEQKIRKSLYRKGLVAKYSFKDIIGNSPAICRTVEKAKRIGKSNAPVLIIAETGCGKELFAQSIHNVSGRCEGPFVAINCGALPANLLESELFGYECGAFTGAKKEGKVGLFELADGGTIFLDEIGEIPLDLQGRLLRVLQEHEILRIGGDKVQKIDIRVISATNMDLYSKVQEGKFRADLYYRLNVMSLTIAPLRMRSDDILLLLDYFLEKYGSAVRSEFLPPEVTKYLTAQTYPGNIRELENLAQRIEAFKEGETSLSMEEIMEIGDAPICRSDDAKGQANSESTGIGETLPADSLVVQLDSLDRIENQVIQHAMNYYGGNKTEVMNTLQISRTTLWKKLKEIEIEEESE